ncbi:preprotein translocase subunit YajC [Coriobacteriia bacterium Es71-Z0120]|jgi:preprotein translocase subunit YajC|uniref:preprotein translocase subunit YajC n=1 Tax=Parvivirga hydrogeniphila TaxID=2939460 RepID=UPI0022608C04|nr:preprotein translocase subunit YajC [Parvivirga hydrogeniphila]MCL4079195.1 preprotein translocase subunit YajC [Parvivirga hydrogeniphila]
MNQQYGQLLSLVLLVVAFYFLLIRPQVKRQKEQQQLMASLAVGDRVVTIGGLYGTIVALADDTVDLKVAEGVVVTYARSAIARKVESGE